MGERFKFESVDEYINYFNGETRKALETLRSLLHKAAPDAHEVISYNIPALKNEKGFVVYFAGYDHHVSISFVPTEPVYEYFANELSQYKKSKSTIQFPLDKPLPLTLIERIIEYRVRHQ